MIHVRYFAHYREDFGVDGEQLEWSADLTTLADLHRHLLGRGGIWKRSLGERNLMCARNQELCDLDELLADGDEVAFFPTVSGG